MVPKCAFDIPSDKFRRLRRAAVEDYLAILDVISIVLSQAGSISGWSRDRDVWKAAAGTHVVEVCRDRQTVAPKRILLAHRVRPGEYRRLGICAVRGRVLGHRVLGRTGRASGRTCPLRGGRRASPTAIPDMPFATAMRLPTSQSEVLHVLSRNQEMQPLDRSIVVEARVEKAGVVSLDFFMTSAGRRSKLPGAQQRYRTAMISDRPRPLQRKRAFGDAGPADA